MKNAGRVNVKKKKPSKPVLKGHTSAVDKDVFISKQRTQNSNNRKTGIEARQTRKRGNEREGDGEGERERN